MLQMGDDLDAQQVIITMVIQPHDAYGHVCAVYNLITLLNSGRAISQLPVGQYMSMALE